MRNRLGVGALCTTAGGQKNARINSTLQVRGYAVYSRLEEKAKAMVLALPLVQDLHHPAMRDRHWALLQKVSGQGGQMHGMTG